MRTKKIIFGKYALNIEYLQDGANAVFNARKNPTAEFNDLCQFIDNKLLINHKKQNLKGIEGAGKRYWGNLNDSSIKKLESISREFNENLNYTLSSDINNGPDFYTREHFELLRNWGGKKYDNNNEEHKVVYKTLKEAYEITKKLAQSIQTDVFPSGFVSARAAPTNQANNFETYQWAKIYSDEISKSCPKEVAFTVSISSDNGLTLKVDTVGLHEKDPFRIAVLNQRGDYNNSNFVKILIEEELLELNFNEALKWCKTEINSLIPLYKKLVDEFNGVDNKESSSMKNKFPENKIYYGPPGTGKTYQLQKLLNENYTDNETVLDTSLWLNQELENLSWHEIIILVLLDLGEANNVTDIISHEYYKIKAELNERTNNLRQTAWAALQAHTVSESETVKFSSRIEPLVFNKTQDSKWFIVDSQNEQVEEYVKILDILKAGPKQTDTVKRYEFVTFHQSYGYEEFIEGLRPKTTEQGDISYEIKPGVFKRVCKLAEADPENQYAMVIDEINRGNISKIFGELITLVEVDKRAGEENELTVTLPYSGLPFTVPSNIDIIGTMNTADRSLTHIDVALRRRFDFKELRTDYSLVSDNVDGINVRWMLYAINQRIELLLDREHILGHALLLSEKVNSLTALKHAFKSNIMPLLEEYFFENWDKINQVLNSNGFVEELKEAASTWLGDSDDYAAKSFRINLNALTNIENYKTIYSEVNESAFDDCETDTE